jgi:hypothetical protein
MRFTLSPTAAALQAAYAPPQSRPADALQPLPASDVLSLEIAHIDTLHQLANGRGTAQTLWDWVANVLMWSRAADLTGLGQDEMREQLQLCLELIARWRRTGRVGFDGPGLQLARHGVDLIDALARQVPLGIARAAAHWSEEQLARMRANDERTPA